MKESHRACLVTWMIVIANRQFHFHDETVFLAVNVLDRFLARTSVAADCFHLLGLTSLLIAAKMVTFAMFALLVFLSTTREVDSVCLSVCQMITFESLDAGSSYLHIRYIFRHYGSSSYVKVIRSRSRSQETKTYKMPITVM